MILMFFVVWLSILLSPTCSYCYKYSWNLYDDGNQYHHQKQQQQPQHHYYQQQNQLPSDIMVDLINELGLKLLAIHNENNENNIALSPYGVFSVLVALGEGVRNEAAHEIVHAAHIPNDIRLVRVGLRDIHRHLKSYFIPKEGFLGGLTFNDDNVVLNTEYEMILRFYGYDVESFNNALYPGPATTQKPMTTTFNYALGQTDTTITTISSVTTIISSTESSTTTMAPITTTKITEPSTTTTRTTETLTTTEKITNTTTEQMTSTTTEQMTRTTTEQMTSTTERPENSTLHRMVPETTTQMETTSLKQEETTTETTTEGTTPARVSRQNLNTTESTISMEITGTTNIKQDETTIETTTINSTPITGSTSSLEEETSTNFMSTEPNQFTDAVITSEDESTIEVPEEYQTTEDINQTTESQTEYDDADYTSKNDEQRNTIESSTTENNEMTTMESSIRKRRSVVDYLIARYYDDHHYKQRNYYHHNYQPEEPFTFLVYNKYRETKINYMRYDTVLPFHYIPHLDALALSFPLDSSKYYLLLLLPTKERGIDKLICDLRLNTNLKYIIRNLRYTHVIATIPSFTLKGYVSLTSSIQKLGIRKVFEPRQADFSPMTTQSDIYVKNIEQAITVTIRNYVDPTLMEPYRNLHQTEPVYFKADHPFLYFVIDSELDVTLMAGKVVNPLNSRIS